MNSDQSADVEGRARVWYHQGLSRKEANDLLLKAGVDGAFLVRDSVTHQNAHVLSLLHQERPLHYLIVRDQLSKFYVQGPQDNLPHFESLDHLVIYFSRNQGFGWMLSVPAVVADPEFPDDETDPGHVHQDGAVHICSDFILGQCKNGARCAKHHCALPYQWQYKNPAKANEWKNFPEVDNKKLEECYCSLNVNVDLQLQGSNPLAAMESELAFSIENMTLSSTNYRILPVHLRRLSTESYVTNPDNPLATKWTWYWQDETNAWKTFGNGADYLAVQEQIEAAFLDQSTEWHKYSSPFFSYGLHFRQKPMYQSNMSTGTKRTIQRKPVFRQKDQVPQLNSSQEQVPFQRPGSDRDPGLPSHWTQMPQGIDFMRVQLSPNSGEFKKVETRFRETMSQYRTPLIKIERVQNPYMWEKFNRKKERMKTKSRGSSLEKDLFHGTDPDTVEKICKENFDWRLYGKNASVYGQGSYFALNASYSKLYSDIVGRNPCQFMFLANVLVGSYVEGDSQMRRPPPKNPSDPKSDLYDSCVDNEDNPEIFVVFDVDQCYPSYVIEYADTFQDHADITTATVAQASPGHTSSGVSNSSTSRSYFRRAASAFGRPVDKNN